MGPELPAPVEPVEGARVVDFPWASAASVLAALESTAAALKASLGARVAMTDTIADWEGTYRDQFDEAHLRLVGVAAELSDLFPARAASVVGVAEDANAEQAGANRLAPVHNLVDNLVDDLTPWS